MGGGETPAPLGVLQRLYILQNGSEINASWNEENELYEFADVNYELPFTLNVEYLPDVNITAEQVQEEWEAVGDQSLFVFTSYSNRKAVYSSVDMRQDRDIDFPAVGNAPAFEVFFS